MRIYLIVIFLSVSLFLGANILNVPAQYHYISLAVLAAEEGDTILVQPGTYSGIINFEGKGITITSTFMFTENEADIHHTLLTGSYSDASIVSFVNGETSASILNGFTITNNSAPAQGGAINIDAASPVLSNLRLINNQATSGGAVFANNADFAMYDCKINDNSGGDYGGAVYLEESVLSMYGCELKNNFCGGDDVNGRAGAVFVSNSHLNCSHCNFRDNEAQAHAGAVYLSYSGADFDRCEFTGNTASGNVGAVYFYNSTHLNVFNCTFYNNTGTDAGALRFFHNQTGEDVPVLINTVCWGNSPSQLTCSADDLINELIIAYCDIEGGEEAIVTNDNADISWLEGNIDSEPMFVSPEYDFFAYETDSPCLDAGTAYFEFESVIYVDLAEDEYLESAPEIGAFETDTANPPLMAMFDYDQNEGEAPLTVQFTDMHIGLAETIEWDFDNDGIIDSNESEPLWIYEEVGVYSVKLCVSAGTQTDQILLVDIINVTEPSADDNNELPVAGNLTVYPNPFNPTTTISYELEAASEVEIDIYNPKGQLVSSLLKGQQSAGIHRLKWNADDYQSSVYFVRIKSDNCIALQKVLLLK